MPFNRYTLPSVRIYFCIARLLAFFEGQTKSGLWVTRRWRNPNGMINIIIFILLFFGMTFPKTPYPFITWISELWFCAKMDNFSQSLRRVEQCIDHKWTWWLSLLSRSDCGRRRILCKRWRYQQKMLVSEPSCMSADVTKHSLVTNTINVSKLL